MMRVLAAAFAALLLPSLAAAAVPCSDLPKAEHFISTRLRPGPNTRTAQQHLAAAKHAKSSRQCSAELARADYYARRSLAADRKRH